MGARHLVWFVAASLLACVPRAYYLPGQGAALVPGQPQTAEQTVQGVQVQVSGAAWGGSSSIYGLLLPVQVRIINHSAHPVRIGYDLFGIAGPTGFRLAPLPPYELVGDGRPTPVRPNFYYDGFYLAPPYSGLYLGMRPWWGPFPFDHYYYPRYYGYWPYSLPTRELMELAIPEGVIEPNGRVMGFLYFQRLSRSWQEVTFQFELVDATTGETFGRLAIPLERGR